MMPDRTNPTPAAAPQPKPTKAAHQSGHSKKKSTPFRGSKPPTFDKSNLPHKRKGPPHHEHHPVSSSFKKPKKDAPETVKLNKELAQYASRKQLPEAQATFNDAVANHLANSYTYVNMMNVCVRCGDLSQATSVFDAMKAAKISPDVVAYTTLLKGLCGEGRLDDAMKHVKAMEAAKVPLNVRTVNTLLRGCILVGDVRTAETIFDATVGKWRLAPDDSTWEYVIALLCRNLQLKKALSVFGRGLLANGCNVGSNAATLLNLARAATLLGDISTAHKYVAMTLRNLATKNPETPEPRNPEDQHGGKRGWHEASESRQESLAVFLQIKRDELARELTVISTYLEQLSQQASNNSDDATARDAILDMYKKVLLIPLTPKRDQSLAEALAVGVLDTMGLRAVLKKHFPDKVATVQLSFERRLSSTTDVVKLRKVFGKDQVQALPVKVEICSGAGEWVVNQAKKDQGKALWVAMEIRHDRVYQIFTQAVFDNVTNLSIIAGDAAVGIQRHMKPNQVDFMFINQPEPPQQTGSMNTQAKHLLTATFLDHAMQLVKPDGRLTIVTDNKWYAQFLLKIVCKLKHVHGVALKKRQTVESNGSFHIYMGHPPKECGVADEHASSYFDRLAKQDSIRGSQGTYFLSIAKRIAA
ncbi:hypothetical protein DYB37_010733 [Aphanomyces astaci]|uniref:tRNA (guanine(46)-N(7))-methyltransferase n=1 Tax=Aphanomyces astaci TaxID=112090 RepID=A0A3R7C1J3_APHAT|nr:hypothetical protein DYB35_010829 [Aphanomyces astaci]RHZ11506.1 hypothetical protein DYB37_010733 [Aphanomyces astaci]